MHRGESQWMGLWNLITLRYLLSSSSIGIRPKHVKDLIPLMILMVIIFLVLLFWENELDEEAMAANLEQLHVDYLRVTFR